MEFSIERTIIITLLFIGFTQAASPRISGKVPDKDYSSVDEDYIGHLFKIRVQDDDTGDSLDVLAKDSFTRQYFNITPYPINEQSNDIWVNVSVQQELDRETLVGSPKVKLLIKDRQNNEIGYEFTVYIQDVNDNPPVFQSQPYNLEIPELPCNETTVVYKITATDKDKNANGRVSYSMVATAQSADTRAEYNNTFQIDNKTGAITREKCLDYETNSYYQFKVMAKDAGPDGGLNSTADFIIRVTDVQDEPPFFTSITFRTTINETILKGSSVLTINARDGDPGVSNDVNYTITDSSCGDVFEINVNNGLIRTKEALDRDAGDIKTQSGNCNLVVLVQEIEKKGQEQHGSTTATTTVTIIVNDVDDNPPVFEETKYIAYVPENTLEDSLLKFNKTITVYDIDQGDNARMDITLENMDNSPCTDFVASPSEIQGKGRVSILVNNSALLDYEQLENKTLYIKVVATEADNGTVKTEANVEVNVMDVNDNYPKFNATKFIIVIPENTENNTIITQITAHDADTYPQFKEITYSVSGGSGRFTADEDTGNIRTLCSTNCSTELDRERRSDFYLTLFATDKSGNRNSTEVIVNLTDVNDNPPQFSRQAYTVFLKENTTNLEVVTVEASDRDQKNTRNVEVTFKIIRSTDNYFEKNLILNETTGEIKLNTTLDYEKLQNLNGTVIITVEVKDKGNPSLSSTCVVEITVQDENDNPPVFDGPVSANVSEDKSSNVSSKTDVTTVHATDKDVTPQNKDLSYFKLAGSDKFTVDPSTGTISITINKELDRETEPQYNLTIIAIDRGSTPLTGTTTVTIYVTDVNDQKPVFSYHEYTASVKENTTSENKMIVKTCNASDNDTDSSLTYTITKVEAQDENGKSVNESLIKDYFGIHQGNGSVFVSGKLDRETAATVRLTIQVNDTNAVLNKPQTDVANLTITLEDINDNAPTFEQTQYSINVSEDAGNGRTYDGPRATDRDINRTITYELQLGLGPINSFEIDSKTGTIVKVGELDRETNSSFSLTVVATDNGVPPLNSSMSVYVRVLDANDNSPVFSNASLKSEKLHIYENAAVGDVIININATDKDEGPNNNNITYFLEKNDYFGINELNGVISVTKTLDREVISQTKLTIYAKDNPASLKTQRTSSMTITVYFEDVNDNSPTFAHNYTPSVEEDKVVGSVIIQVSATDRDEANTNNSKISYYIKDSMDNKFSIDESTGQIKINSSLVDCVGYYVVEVVAYDHGNPQRNGSTTVNVTVTDKNRHKPVIGNLLVENEIKIFECAKHGTVIHTFNYTDADFGVNAEATFNISSTTLDDVTNVFSLTKDGNLTVIGKLDVNIKSSYTFEIIATDHGAPPLTSEGVQITVGIMDVDDHAPSFQKDKVRFTMQENMVTNKSIGSVTAFDKDTDSKPCYELEGNVEKRLFNVSEIGGTGYIFILRTLDYEMNQTIKFNVSVKDCLTDENIADYCDKDLNNKIQKVKEEINATIEVIVEVIDINDNPPVFKKNQFATGMRRNTEADAELELHLRNETYISDADSPQNGILSWTFSNYGNITVGPGLRDKIDENSGARPCDDGLNHLFCVTKNGTIVNNKFFSEDLSGYFIVTVKVADSGGNDTADITIYLISDSQVVTMTIRNNKGNVAEFKDELLQELSSILGHTAVFDSLQDHKENGEINTQSSDLSFHIVDKDSKAVLSGDDAIELFDKHASNGQMIALQNRYNVITVAKQTMTEISDKTSSEKLTFILVAISVAEALIIATIIFIAMSVRKKFRRKLKAAAITTPDMEMHALDQKEAAIPGSNLYSKQSNPLFNTEVMKTVQEVNIYNSISSAEDVDLDVNDVDDPSTVYDKMEEREVTIDMYNDDTGKNVSSEDLLGAALQHHAMRKSKENLDTLDDTDESHQSTDNPAAFINDAYTDEFESTEI